ncbi:hypothetical protein ABZT04_43215 [Streptomyces sp. NPDC005492]
MPSDDRPVQGHLAGPGACGTYFQCVRCLYMWRTTEVPVVPPLIAG